MGTIFWLSHQRGTSLELPEIPYIDKLAHGLIYAILAWAAIFAVPAENTGRRAKRFGVFVVLFCLMYGLSDEFHQSFIPGRFPSMGDLAADVVGATLAVFAWNLWNRKQQVTPAAS